MRSVPSSLYVILDHGAVTCCNRLCDDVRANASDGVCLPVYVIASIVIPSLLFHRYTRTPSYTSASFMVAR